MSAIKKLIPLFVLVGLGGAGAGAYFYYKHLETVDKTRRSQLFADVSQCLVGKPIPLEADALLEMGLVEARLAHRPSEMGPAGKEGWPLRCSDRTNDLMSAVRDSSFLEQDAKLTLLDKVDALKKQIDSQPKEHGSLTGYVASLWREAPKLGLTMASQSSVPGPPRPVAMEGDAHLPLAEILPIDGGPGWAFLAAKRGDAAAIGFCLESAQGLACTDFHADGHLQPAGGWEDPTFIPFSDGDRLMLFHDGSVTDTKLRSGETFVDKNGTVFDLILERGSSDRTLTVKPFGKAAKPIGLADALSNFPELPEDAAVNARLLGPNIMVSGPNLWRIPIGDSGKLGKPIDIGGGTAGLAHGGCRSGPTYVLEIALPASALVFFDDQHILGRVPRSVPLRECGKSGETWDRTGQICQSTGCHDPVPEALRALLPHEAAQGLAGSHVVVAWGVRDGKGLLVRVAGDNDLSDTPDTLVLDHTDPKALPRTAVFGGPTGALIFAEVDEDVMGAHVTADGKVEAIHIDWK